MNFVRIVGYPYVVHPCGTVLRIWKSMNKTKEMKTWKEKSGYMRIGLTNNGKTKFFYIHRLLAIAFIPNPENKSEVNHIDGNRANNMLENLRWLTNKENLNAFRSNPAAVITKGGISKRKDGIWQWTYYMSGKQKTKYMKSKEDLLKFRKKKLSQYNINV